MFQVPNSEQNPVDSETFHNHATELNFMVPIDYTSNEHLSLPVFGDAERTIVEEPSPIYRHEEVRDVTNQPQRRPIPVSVIDFQTRDETQFIATSGLDFLNGTAQLIIQQTVELLELQSSAASEKRYLVKRNEGETIYYATEQSTSLQRMCFGSTRKFEMTLQDRTQQEALKLKRRLACGTCSFWCYLQVLEVWTPEELIGYVKQEMSCGMPCLTVRDLYNNIHYRIEGPPVCACRYAKEAHFKIYSSDGMTQCGSINHFWNQVQVEYTLGIQFPSPNTDKKKKALLLGAAFLLEYMFFESSRNGTCACIC